MLDMLENVIRVCPEALWSQNGSIGVREHAYHVLSSMDLWIHDFSASGYEPPSFHERDAAMLTGAASEGLTRGVLLGYLRTIRAKYTQRLDQSDTALLREELLRGRSFSLVDRCLSQLRHTQHHVGLIHRMIRERNGSELPWRSHGES